jgi:hypothetical protein
MGETGICVGVALRTADGAQVLFQLGGGNSRGGNNGSRLAFALFKVRRLRTGDLTGRPVQPADKDVLILEEFGNREGGAATLAALTAFCAGE